MHLPQDLKDLQRRFRITAELGRGGMGTVYRAHDPAAGRDVALKVLLKTSGVQRSRFRREGEITASLEHPGIVRVYASGESGGRLWIAYELIPGARSLDEVFREVDLRTRVALTRDLARALGFAHARGVVHRDVKPDNALVDERGNVRLADFGLASAFDRERLTKTGMWVGTPHFMAPEQVATVRDLGPEVDTWALGVLLYLALTEQLPFNADSMMELCAAITAGVVVAPSKLASVPRDLEAICLRALDTSADARFGNGDLLADDLDAWLAGQRPSASTSAGARARSRSRALAGACALLVCASAVALWLAGGGRQDPAPTEAPAATKPSSPAPKRSATVAATAAEVRALPKHEQPRALASARAALRAATPSSAGAEAEQIATELAKLRQLAKEHRAQPLALYAHAEQFLALGHFAGKEGVLTHGRDGVRVFALGAPEKPLAVVLTGRWVEYVLPRADGRFLVTQRPQAKTGRLAWLQLPAAGAELAIKPLEVPADVVAQSRDRRFIAAGTFRQHVDLRDGRTFAQLRRLGERMRFPAVEFAFDRRSERLFVITGNRYGETGAAGSQLLVYGVARGELLWERALPPRGEFVVADSAGNSLVGCSLGDLFRYDSEGKATRFVAPPETRAQRRDSTFRSAKVGSIGTFRDAWLSDDEREVITISGSPGQSGDEMEVRRWDFKTGRHLGWLYRSDAAGVSLEVDAERRLMLIGTRQGSVQLWSLDALSAP